MYVVLYRFNTSMLLWYCKKKQYGQVFYSVLSCISNRKRSLVAHHDSLKMCDDRDLSIWLW